ncbi:MAG: prolyl oligopeptidase family serine peptidase, partial [Synergistaceae bacterium]|nr:prolyl oligopeptidase family serine peptidase [Synergistaceae bacterium]
MRILFVLFALLLAMPAACASAAVPPILPMEDFFRNPENSAFSISPDGKWLAFARPWQHRMNVYVREISTGTEKRITSATERDISGFFWKGNGRIVFAQDSGGDENFHVYITDIMGGEARDLTPFDKVKAGVLDDLEDDPVHMLIDMNRENPEVFDVYRCNIETGELELVGRNPGNITGWLTDHDGKLRCAFQTDGVNETFLYRTDETQSFRPLITTNFKETFSPVMFAYDNKTMYVVSNLSRDKAAIYTFDPEKNETIDLVFEHDEVDAGGIMHSKKRKIITGVTYTTDRRHYKFFDASREELQKTIDAFFPGLEVAAVDTDDDEQRYIVRTYSDRTRGTYYLFDRRDNSISKLADLSPWLKADQMAPMKAITFTARDGAKINGYLTLPVGVEEKNLPLVVIPHGGPSARDVWGFDSEAQFLANRGIAVLQVNFRGSTGYGKAFW